MQARRDLAGLPLKFIGEGPLLHKAISLNPKSVEVLGKNARAEYEAKYTAERNYEMLMEIYERAISQAHSIE